MLQRSILLCCLVGAASAVVTYRCGGKSGLTEPCEKRQPKCDVECYSSEFCKKSKGDSWYCNVERNRGCCMQYPHWNKNRTLGCELAECNSNEYCDMVKAGSTCVNGCCLEPEKKEIFMRDAIKPRTYFSVYWCNKGTKSATACERKACNQECHTTPGCQKTNGPGFFCTSYSHCCIEDASYGLEEQRNCERLECNSHEYCRANLPGSHCSEGCCVANQDPVPEGIVSPPIPEPKKVTEGADATDAPKDTEGPDATEAPEENTKTPEATEAPESKKAPESTETSESTKAPEENQAREGAQPTESKKAPEATEAPEPVIKAISPPVPEPTKVTEGAEGSEAPESTKAPEVTEAPESTKAPEITEAPEPVIKAISPPVPEPTKVTEGAEGSEAPESTKAPEVTEAPESTKAPEVTEAPESVIKAISPPVPEPIKVTEGTEGSEAPESTKAPEVTEAIDSTKAPEVTEAPKSVIKAISPPFPEPTQVTEGAEGSESPESTKAPEATEAPESTNAPEATEESTKAPEATEAA